MIRMGRSSKPEQSNEEINTPPPSVNTGIRNTYRGGNIAPTGQALTESESMARDIKEGRLSGFVGSGTVLTGETNFQSMLRVDGHLTGSVSSDDGTLIVGTSGKVDANVKVAAAVINGTVNGDIIASEKLELGRTAKVTGNIQTPRLVIEDGALLEGSCTMLKAQEDLEKRKSQAQAQIAVANEFSAYQPEEVLEVEEADDVTEEEEEAAEAAAN
ncbi:MAG: polymer-forming cytoskeletal protein [Pyrinomonadaceae bacterium]